MLCHLSVFWAFSISGNKQFCEPKFYARQHIRDSREWPEKFPNPGKMISLWLDILLLEHLKLKTSIQAFCTSPALFSERGVIRISRYDVATWKTSAKTRHFISKLMHDVQEYCFCPFEIGILALAWDDWMDIHRKWACVEILVHVKDCQAARSRQSRALHYGVLHSLDVALVCLF